MHYPVLINTKVELESHSICKKLCFFCIEYTLNFMKSNLNKTRGFTEVFQNNCSIGNNNKGRGQRQSKRWTDKEIASPTQIAGFISRQEANWRLGFKASWKKVSKHFLWMFFTFRQMQVCIMYWKKWVTGNWKNMRITH